MGKIIVTHVSCDLDGITCIWLIRKYLPGWQKAEIIFVPAGTTLNNRPADEDPNILHVDTGMGKFDHHQIKDRHLSAAKRVLQHLEKEKLIKDKEVEAIRRIVEYVANIDNFGEVFFPEPTLDIYDFMLHQIIEGLRATRGDDSERCSLGIELLEAELQIFKNKLKAEEEIKKGLVFKSKYGNSLGMETRNEEAIKLALKSGYLLVVRKDPERGFVRIKTLPDDKIDLTPVYKSVKKADPGADWFLHVSKNMLLNGSAKNPKVIASKLSLKQVIDLIKKI